MMPQLCRCTNCSTAAAAASYAEYQMSNFRTKKFLLFIYIQVFQVKLIRYLKKKHKLYKMILFLEIHPPAPVPYFHHFTFSVNKGLSFESAAPHQKHIHATIYSYNSRF